MHLDTGRRHVDAGLGEPALHDRDHEVDESLVARALFLVRVLQRLVHRRRDDVAQRAHRLGLGLHAHQHAAHVGVVDDGHRLAAARDVAALDALFRIGERLLVGALGDRKAFHAHRESREIHHDEHVFQAAILLADQVADRVFVYEDGSRARVDAELVLDRGALHLVPLPRRAVGVHQELRHEEQRDAAHALGRALHAREHEMDDVLRQIVLAVGDEDLLSRDAVMITLADRLGANERQIGARLRLGEIHGAGPAALDHFREVSLFLFLGTAQDQCLDCPRGEHRDEREREVRRFPHLDDGRRDDLGQPLSAVLGGRLQRVPPAFHELPIRLLEARGRGDPALVPLRALLVGGLVERREHAACELRAFLEDLVDEFGVDLLQAGQLRDLGQAGQFLQHEVHVAKRCLVFAHRCLCKNRLSQLFHQFRNDLEQVSHDPVVRHLEYRRFLVLVDGDDDAAVLHAR